MQQAITWANVGPYHITIWHHLNQWWPKSCHHMASLCHNGLTHWGRVMHICVSKLTIIGSVNCLSLGWCQAIFWTTDGILLTDTLGTNYSEILIEIQTFSFKKMHLKMSSRKWQPSCLGLNTLRPSDAICRHRSGSTLVQVMACYLTAPSHYLNQCWLTISKV